MTTEKFPPRAWLRYGSNWIEGHLNPKVDPSEIPYISLEEHSAILREAKAAVWEEAASFVDKRETHGVIAMVFRQAAKDERESVQKFIETVGNAPRRNEDNT